MYNKSRLWKLKEEFDFFLLLIKCLNKKTNILTILYKKSPGFFMNHLNGSLYVIDNKTFCEKRILLFHFQICCTFKLYYNKTVINQNIVFIFLLLNFFFSQKWFIPCQSLIRWNYDEICFVGILNCYLGNKWSYSSNWVSYTLNG